MSEAKYHYSKEDFDHYMARIKKTKQRKKTAGGPGSHSIPIDESEGSTPSDQEAGEKLALALPGKTKSAPKMVQIMLPADASARTNYEAFSGEFEKLLLSEDKNFIKNHTSPCYELATSAAFKSYQYTLFMKEQLNKLEEKVQGVKDDRDAIEENLQLVKEELCEGQAEWTVTQAYLQGQLTLKAQEINRLKAMLAEIKRSKEQEIKDACYETAIQIRGTMSQQYLDKETGGWPIEVNISRWRELQELRSGDSMNHDDDNDDDVAARGNNGNTSGE